MTGPQHFRKAEEWVRYATDLYKTSGDGDASEVPAGQLAAGIAQVHATLALAAAAAIGHADLMHDLDAIAWQRVAGEPDRPDGCE